jgi:hypothetical protein
LRTSFSIALASNLVLNSIYANVDRAACVYIFGQAGINIASKYS